MAVSDFSAKASALGYEYQLRYALHLALEGLAGDLDWSIAIEAADDIELARPGEVDLLQLKHRAESAVLSDSHSDLWKSLRIWCSAYANRRIDPASTRLLLITTATLSPDSALALLSADPQRRDAGAALQRLRAVVEDSKSAANVSAYEAFSALDADAQHRLVNSITVHDGELRIEGIESRIRDKAIYAVGQSNATAFLERLDGWWFRRALGMLMDEEDLTIEADEVDAKFSGLREQFRTDSLPIDFLEMDADSLANENEDFGRRVFVQQLALANINDKRVGYAIRDYLRAFAQRSKWSRDGLLLVGELTAYEARLTDEWSRLFERYKDELGADAAEEAMVDAARRLYAWAESEADFPIRDRCREPYVVRGTFHHLADEQRVGWHPEFEARLAALLEPAEG